MLSTYRCLERLAVTELPMIILELGGEARLAIASHS